MKVTLALLSAGAAYAASGPLMARNGGVNCAALNTIISIMHEQAVATPFCSSYLKIGTVTSTATSTVSQSPTTVTTTVRSTDTVTTTTVTTTDAGTTTYGSYYAISTTSTCALSATVINTSSAPNQKRYAPTPCTTSVPPPISSIALGTPVALTGFIQTDVSSACSCLSIASKTTVTTTTTTLPQSTITSTVASTAHSTVTVTSTTSTFGKTYTATQYYTSTFTMLPPPSSTIAPPAYPQETFGVYSNLDFSGHDLVSFFCNSQATPPSPFQGTSCKNFADCVNECAYYNKNQLGGNQTCGAVVYNAPPGTDGSQGSGSCYLKSYVEGCGGDNTYTNTGVILPLQAYDPQ